MIVLVFRGDTFAVELLDGYLYIILQHGGENIRKRLGKMQLNNGEMHSLKVTFREWGAVTVVRIIIML